ncbi:MAG TPA: paraquat-inducible protein A [Candidatus Methylomirabilis sp.]|nr:paraquat-inducible protein A [Candidatus Methylomirabilis sp.]
MATPAPHPVETIACEECDLLQRVPEMPPGSKARCQRCGNTLLSRPTDPLDRPLALTIAAAITFIVAHTTPLMGLSAVGRHASTTIAGGALGMWREGEQLTAVIVAFCAGIAPGGYILFMLTVLIMVRRPPAPQWVGEMVRWGRAMAPWSMNEVMILGILVALIKIAELASVEPGIAMYAIGVLVVLFAAIMVTVDPHEAWRRIEWADAEQSPRRASHGEPQEAAR